MLKTEIALKSFFKPVLALTFSKRHIKKNFLILVEILLNDISVYRRTLSFPNDGALRVALLWKLCSGAL